MVAQGLCEPENAHGLSLAALVRPAERHNGTTGARLPAPHFQRGRRCIRSEIDAPALRGLPAVAALSSYRARNSDKAEPAVADPILRLNRRRHEQTLHQGVLGSLFRNITCFFQRDKDKTAPDYSLESGASIQRW